MYFNWCRSYTWIDIGKYIKRINLIKKLCRMDKWKKIFLSHLLQSTTLRRPLALGANSKLKNLFVRNNSRSDRDRMRDGSEKEANDDETRTLKPAIVYIVYTPHHTVHSFVSADAVENSRDRFESDLGSCFFQHSHCPTHTHTYKQSKWRTKR